MPYTFRVEFLFTFINKTQHLTTNQFKFRAKRKNDKFTIQNGTKSILYTFNAAFAYVVINNTQQPTKKQTVLSENVKILSLHF